MTRTGLRQMRYLSAARLRMSPWSAGGFQPQVQPGLETIFIEIVVQTWVLETWVKPEFRNLGSQTQVRTTILATELFEPGLKPRFKTQV